jgi:hypothetical protein
MSSQDGHPRVRHGLSLACGCGLWAYAATNITVSAPKPFIRWAHHVEVFAVRMQFLILVMRCK